MELTKPPRAGEAPPGATVELVYKQTGVDGGGPETSRALSLEARVRSNTLGSPTGEGLLGDVEKLVAETSGRSDSVRVEAWPDGAVRVTGGRHGRTELGRLVDWSTSNR